MRVIGACRRLVAKLLPVFLPVANIFLEPITMAGRSPLTIVLLRDGAVHRMHSSGYWLSIQTCWENTFGQVLIIWANRHLIIRRRPIC
ncbi:hypothetical protein D3C73_790230 [compost metagenome]